MTTQSHASISAPGTAVRPHPVDVAITTQMSGRNRLTCAFRFILSVPHMMLVGTPAALAFAYAWHTDGNPHAEWGIGPGALGALASIVAIIAWFSIVFTGEHPAGLWNLAAFYLRWRVRAISYMALLRDEYPPFDDAPYPATLGLAPQTTSRNRPSVAFRMFIALPHVIVLCFVGFAWALATAYAWFVILFTGSYPRRLRHFAEGALRWTTRLEAYLLLLHDEYPPFSLD